MAMTVQFASSARNRPSRSRLRAWARAALERDARVTVRLVGRGEGRILNRRFRGRDYPTNVLTFVFRDEPPYEGDLAVCAPVVTREARALGITVQAHYAHLIVHGMLHLQGYDHENEADARVMEARESRILTGLGYADPYDGADKSSVRARRARAAGLFRVNRS